MSEPIYLEYGRCPRCGKACQPDFIPPDYDVEFVECDDCDIMWTLYHDDETDKRDGTEPWRTYRIGEIEKR